MLFAFIIFLSCGEQPSQTTKQTLVLKDLELLEQEHENLKKAQKELEKQKILEDSQNLVYIDENSFYPPPPPPPPPPKQDMNEQIKKDLKEAHSKADCMLDYLRKKESGNLDKSYEEFCD